MLNFSIGARELANYYDQPAPDLSDIQRDIDNWVDSSLPTDSTAGIKAGIHEIIATRCPIRIFPHFPFFQEIACTRPRASWGVLQPMASSLLARKRGEFIGGFCKELTRFSDQGIVRAWIPVSYDHHAPSYDYILKFGVTGFIRKLQKRLAITKNQRQRDFLEASIKSCNAVIKLAHRFHQLASDMLKDETLDQDAKKNLLRIAETAVKCPEFPPTSFYEALQTIFFMREIIGSLEAFGMSTFGHLDRLLGPYLENDLKNHTITIDEAQTLIHELLAFTDAKFNISDKVYNETSTTVVIGGCTKQGSPVFNEVTKLIVNAEIENRYNGTKIIARASKQHPKEYFELLAKYAASRANTFVIQNDDVLIQANVLRGIKQADARLYVAGGCHEILVGGTEVNSRADTWFNLPMVLLRTLRREAFGEKQADDRPCESFEGFCNRVFDNLQYAHDDIAALKTKYEEQWPLVDAAPFFSACVEDCIKKAKDVTEGGARYNHVSISMVGVATFIDSLFAIKHLVFDTAQLTLPELTAVLDSDYAGHEALKLYIRNKIAKFGTEDREIQHFASQIMTRLSDLAGQPNARGGVFKPAIYPHNLYMALGKITPATPDGRNAFTYLSRGISPSEFVKTPSVTEIINSLQELKLHEFPESLVLDLTLPCSINQPIQPEALETLITAFLRRGGSTLQLNLLDTQQLIEAKKHPEKHPNLIVRICGYSRAFNTLDPESQDEVINRAMSQL